MSKIAEIGPLVKKMVLFANICGLNICLGLLMIVTVVQTSQYEEIWYKIFSGLSFTLWLCPFVFNLTKWMRLLRVQIQLINKHESTNRIINKMQSSRRLQRGIIAAWLLLTLSITLFIFVQRNISLHLRSQLSKVTTITFQLIWLAYIPYLLHCSNKFALFFRQLGDTSYPVRSTRGALGGFWVIVVTFTLTLQIYGRDEQAGSETESGGTQITELNLSQMTIIYSIPIFFQLLLLFQIASFYYLADVNFEDIEENGSVLQDRGINTSHQTSLSEKSTSFTSVSQTRDPVSSQNDGGLVSLLDQSGISICDEDEELRNRVRKQFASIT